MTSGEHQMARMDKPSGAGALLKAARLLREDHPPCSCGYMTCPTLFFEATALLLENEAHAWDAQDAHESDWPDVTVNPARRALLTDVARAYLGESA